MVMLKRILRFVFLTAVKKVETIVRRHYYLGVLKGDINKFILCGGKVRHLTKAQKQQVYDLWGGRVDTRTHELIYSATGRFMAEYCPYTHFRLAIEPVLNNQAMVPAWGDKNLFEKLFPDVRFPNTIVRNINGIYYDHSYNVISKKMAISLAGDIDKSIIKPTVGSLCGAGVALLHKEDDIHSVFDKYKNNFAVQELLVQHPEIAKFNESSVNVIRYNTLFLDGEVHPLSATLRIGAEGAINDNSILSDGRGMIVVNINHDGRLDEVAYYSNGKSIRTSHNGVLFKGSEIPNFNKVTETVVNMHKQMAHFGFIGFDVAIGIDAEPVIMEYNVFTPGVIYYQYTGGPLFGKYTKRIAEQFRR